MSCKAGNIARNFRLKSGLLCGCTLIIWKFGMVSDVLKIFPVCMEAPNIIYNTGT